ncbi:hypothetical protein OC835_006800 [Tilletia horrida]|nr:hypothetical protein OC835_006800 [Tilletia horrida]
MAEPGDASEQQQRSHPPQSQTGLSPGEPFWGLNRHTPGRTNGTGRKTSHRRSGPLSYRDRSVLRVAASLFDENRPADSEIASEAKLQRKVKSDCASPRSMHFASMMTPSPSHHAGPGPHPLPKNFDLEDEYSVGMQEADFEDDLDSLTSDDEEDELGGSVGVGGSAGMGEASPLVGSSSGLGSATGPRSIGRSIDGASDGEVEMSFDTAGDASSETNASVSVAGEPTSLGAPQPATAATAAGQSANSSSGSLSTSMPTPSNFAKKGAQWTNFRATPRARSSARTSPGLERIYRPRTPGPSLGAGGRAGAAEGGAPPSAPSSTSSMDTSEVPPMSGGAGMAPLLMSPSMWTTFVRHGKRKLGTDHERYEPYASSAAKRRAVSPIAYLASVSSSAAAAAAAASALGVQTGGPHCVHLHGSGAGHGSSSAGVSSASAASSPSTGAIANGLPLPNPTPLSMPSPTNPLIQPFWATTSAAAAAAAAAAHYHQHHRTLSGPYSRSASAFATAAAASSSRSGSPATRPSTPTNLTAAPPPWHLNGGAGGSAGGTPNGMGAGSAGPGSAPPSLLPLSLTLRENINAGLASPSLLATQTPGSAGSGPGYGSMPAALGLSLGGNSAARTKDAEEEEGNREGMDEGVRMLGLG